MRIQLLDEDYLTWLYSQVADATVENPELTYWKLLKYLFTEEFTWSVPNDDNRLEDGKALRLEFVDTGMYQNVPDDWFELPCSVLELMVGLARRLEFEADGKAHYWFWRMMENIRLNKYCDSWRLQKKTIEHIISRVMLREYKADGQGGFFPLKYPEKDQRQVELWYQLSAYVLELDAI